jgi:tetratricopeptide (TPR) repeat protein
MRRTGRLQLLVAVASVLLAESAMAYYFIPTDAEWAAWPDYCKARYVTTGIGGSSPFANAFPRSQAEVWRRKLGDDTFIDIHHYCAGLASTTRALLERDPRARHAHLDYALDNSTYSFHRTPRTSFIYVKIALNLAVIETNLGNPERGIEYAQQALDAQPKNAEPYVALAQLYFQQDKKQKAREVLVSGNDAVEGESAEIHYTLGLIEADLGQLESAVGHARQAYALGHPLPGLRRKLEKLGAWSE